MLEVQKFTVDAMIDRLRSKGMRITQGRRSILQALFDADHPLSLVEIQQRAGALGDGPPDYATVFRMMMALEELRLVHKVNLQRSCSYFELNDPDRHYDHLVCRDCGKVLVLDIPCPVEEAERFIENQFGYSHLSHSLEFFGRCPECSEPAAVRPLERQPAASLSPDMRR